MATKQPSSNETRPYTLIGGGGFLGAAFAEFLKSEGSTVQIVRKGELQTIPDKQTPSIIVDFAYTSLPNTSYNDPVKDFSENLLNVIQHLEYARSTTGSTFVYISSGGTVYGNAAPTPIDENHPNVPLSPYGITKLACEKYILMYKEVYGLDVRIVRPGNIYGPGQRPFRGQGLVATALAKVLKREPFQIFGDGSSVRDYLYITDFCELLDDIIHHGKNGEVYNMGSGTGTSITEILREIISLNDDQAGELIYLPARPFDVHFNVLNSSKARALNSWRPKVTMHAGFEQTMHWMRDYLSKQK